MTANRNGSDLSPRRKIFGRLSITAGNALQISGIVAACLALAGARSAHSTTSAVVAVVVGWVLLYFCCHAIAHWVVGEFLAFASLSTRSAGPGIQKAGLLDSAGCSKIFLFLECRRRRP